MRKCVFVIALVFVAISIHLEASDWTIFDKGGNILHVIRNAEDVDPFNGEVFVVRYEDGFAFLDKNFSEVLRGSFELERTGLHDDRIGFYDSASDMRGYLNGKGEVVIEPRFDYVGRFIHGHAVVGFGDTRKEFPLFTYRLIDTSGNYTSPDEFGGHLELSRYEPNKAFVKKRGEKVYQFIEFDGSIWQPVPTSVEFRSLMAASGFVIYRTKHKRGYGFVSWDGEILTEQIYDEVYSTDYRIGALVSVGGNRRLVIDRFGNPIEIEVQGSMWHIFDDRYVTFINNDKTGVYDFKAKKIVIPPIYDSILVYNEEIFNVSKNGKRGFANIQGEVVVEPIYDNVVYFNKGFGIGIKY